MTKQEQIKEIAKTICGYCNREEQCTALNNALCDKFNSKNCRYKDAAEKLYDAGYRKTFTSDLASGKMKYSQEKIIEALTVIKETCKENKDCNKCPFGERRNCLISSDGICPEEWVLNEDKSWKALFI